MQPGYNRFATTLRHPLLMGNTAGDLVGRIGHRAWAPPATVLEQAQIEPGSAVLYLGCPELGALQALANHIGPAGLVTVVEADGWVTAQARRYVADVRLPNVEILWRRRWHAELRTSVFDVVHLRDPLVVLPWFRRRRLLRRVVAITVPGGWIVSHERPSVLDRSPWTAVRHFAGCGLVAVSTEPAQDAGLATATGGESLSYLVWGRKPEVSPRRWARRRGSCRRPLLPVEGPAPRRAGFGSAR